MQKNYSKLWLSAVLFLITSIASFAQGVKGIVKDAATGQGIPGASVVIEGRSSGAASDANGGYTLRVGAGTYKIKISSVGYETGNISVTVKGNEFTAQDIELKESSSSLGEVVVIGSRSTTIRSNTDTPAPIDVITAKDLQATGQIEPSQMINFVAPSFNSSRQTVADGTDHIDPATLRGLGPDQVLVLVNGKRRHNTALININGTVGRGSVGTDLNSIPASSIERIEVLRDGAASQYGSDAIAGVINIVLKKNVDKLNVTSQFGQQYAGDGGVAQVGINRGWKIFKEGYVNVSLDIRRRGATNRAGDYSGPVYVNWNTGAVADRPAKFQQDQALIAQNNFSLAKNMNVGNSQVDNIGGTVNFGIPVSKGIEAYGNLSFNNRHGKAAGFYRYPFQTTQVKKDIYPNGFLPEIHTKINDISGMIGIQGDSNGWRWDISNTYGKNSFRFDVKNSNNATQVDKQTTFYAGTLNFGQNTINAGVAKDFGKEIGLESFNLATGLEYRTDMYKIEAGEEASYKNYDPSSGKAPGAQVFPGFEPSNAVDVSRNVFGAYFDVETDITKSLLVTTAVRYENYSDFGSNVAGKLGLRLKLDDVFAIRGAISNGFRAPSIHQGNFSAIATQFVSVAGEGLVPRQVGTFRNGSDIANAFGIPKLTPEKSDNYSIGLTVKPDDNISLTIDAYEIDIKDRIIYTGTFQRSNATVAKILDDAGKKDVNAAAFFANAVNTKTTGIDLVLAGSPRLDKGSLDLTLAANFNKTEVIGDARGTDKIPSDKFGNTLFNRQERSRLELAQPRNKITFGANYKLGKFGAVLRVTRFGEVSTLDPSNPNLDEAFTPKALTDFSMNYKVTSNLMVTLGANNIFDVYPDKLKQTTAPTPALTTAFDNTSFGRFVYSRNATQFGFNGGYYFLNLSANF
jgi:iron complex outermembrane recepter protein